MDICFHVSESYLGMALLLHMVNLFNFKKNLPNCSPEWLHPFTSSSPFCTPHLRGAHSRRPHRLQVLDPGLEGRPVVSEGRAVAHAFNYQVVLAPPAFGFP